MRLFNNKKGEDVEKIPSLPELPPLPELPELPEMEDFQEFERNEIQKLPSIPSSSFGEKFSRNAIKEAVSREKGVMENQEADEFADEEEEITQRMPVSPKKRMTRELPGRKTEEVPMDFREAARVVRESKPIFVRIDKFEESRKIFNDTKRKIMEIEKQLREIKSIKEKEDADLQAWENDIQTMKQKIDKIDQEIFSKLD